MNEKEALEESAVLEFCNAYKEAEHGEISFIRSLQPPYPDTLCIKNGTELHIEVGHIYGTIGDTKLLLGREGNSAPSTQELSLSTMLPLNKRFIYPLNSLLAKKSKKNYKGNSIWLIIRSGNLLWNRDEFEKHINEILLPNIHPFDQIWLLCGPRSDFGIMRLDNEN